jgi:hypothetical protein
MSDLGFRISERNKLFPKSDIRNPKFPAAALLDADS